MIELFIKDGYSESKKVPGVAGLYPPLAVTYRPALDRERVALRQKTAAGDPDTIVRHISELLQRQGVIVNGNELAKLPVAEVNALKPEIRTLLVNLVLGYDPADEAADAGNSRSG